MKVISLQTAVSATLLGYVGVHCYLIYVKQAHKFISTKIHCLSFQGKKKIDGNKKISLVVVQLIVVAL